ncbi:MAG: AbiH family protein, partial [Oscillospiraceae bacterium]
MNVTYLIGNGFDLGIGLETSFKHFLNYYIDQPSIKEEIAEFKNTIQAETIELWADFEKCFGEYIANFNNNTIDQYIVIYEDVLRELNKCLNNENEKFSDDISNDIQQISDWIRLTNIETIGFRPAVRDNFRNITGYNITTMDVNYDFLSFNYTTTLDRIIEKIVAINNGVLCSYENRYFRKIGSIIHVHGTLNENVIMGVNDCEQLPFTGDLPDKIRRRIIKPEKNVAIGYKIDDQASNCIKHSNIICIYGMSVGLTDTI